MRTVPQVSEVSRKLRPLCFRPLCFALVLGCAAVEGQRAYRSGTSALERGDAASAVVEFEEAARLAPGSSEVYNRLGIAYATVGRRDDAIEAFERSVALDCDNANARRNLARARAGSEARP